MEPQISQMTTDNGDRENYGEVEFLFKELTYAVIGAAIEVHRVLGPGFLEKVYENSLVHELALRKINFRQQMELQVVYKGKAVGLYTADLVVDDKVIVELKAEKTLTKVDEAQLVNYLKSTGFRVGLVLNFGADSLQKIRRVV